MKLREQSTSQSRGKIKKDSYELILWEKVIEKKILKKSSKVRKALIPPPREKQSHRYEKPEKKFDMLIDIQDIIAKGKGPGYERWAKVHNIKQIS